MISKAHHAEINKLSNINKTNKMRKNKKKNLLLLQKCIDLFEKVSIRFRYLEVLGYRVPGIDIGAAR